MSYILDSLKKSDKERRSIDAPTAMVMSSPAFLDNDKPKSNTRLILIFCIVLLLCVGIYFLILHSDKVTQLMGNKQGIALKQPVLLNESKPIDKPPSSQEKEEAILLYKQALSTKSQPEIDSLYKELNDKNISAPNVNVSSVDSNKDVSEPQLVSALETTRTTSPDLNANVVSSLDSNPNDLGATAGSGSLEPIAETPIAQPESVRIPSIYQLDAYVRKDIPSVDYGAHIYATDNNSGFVILDGARRRAGDKLDSGLFVEKIEEESVVLSFNGTLFSLPAMKSWEGK
ncbi:MAG: general secretion pathway protein GspB [Cellvibrionaceae bacterium]